MRQRDPQPGSSAEPARQSATQSETLPVLLRETLRRVLTEERYKTSEEATLRIALREACERARRESVRVEHLLIVLKESWRELPERAPMPHHDADNTLARVVSACINEYYQDHAVVAEYDSPSRCFHEAERIHALPPSGENR